MIEKNSKKCRIYSFGVGADVDKEYIKKIARITKGRSEFISNSDSLESKAAYYLHKMVSRHIPLMRDISINWSNLQLKVTQTPFNLPTIYQSEGKLVYGFIPHSNDFQWTGDESITINYMVCIFST